MDTRYDPDTGKLFVPLDIRTDVIEPLRLVQEKADAIGERLGEHLDRHVADAEARVAQRTKMFKYGKWAGSGLVGLISLALTIRGVL